MERWRFSAWLGEKLGFGEDNPVLLLHKITHQVVSVGGWAERRLIKPEDL
jgi:hypothetical protein